MPRSKKPLNNVLWSPTPKQKDFLACPAFEALYGGAAGGGKTAAIIIAAFRKTENPQYRGLILRRTFPQLQQIIAEAQHYYRSQGAIYRSAERIFRFPSGAEIRLGHVETENDVYSYQGQAYQTICFDELTQFTERMYTYLLTRARSAHGIDSHIRSTSNPGGQGHEWVFRRFSPWLDPKSTEHAEPGEILWAENRHEQTLYHREPLSGALTRCFIPAKLDDNPHLVLNDPEYRVRLEAQDFVTRQQLLHGDWLAQPGKGLLFKREWFPQDQAAHHGSIVRAWDLGSTVDGDYTVGIKLQRLEGPRFLVIDVIRMRGRPSDVERTILETAKLDGPDIGIVLPEDPGQAGKFQIEHFRRQFMGWNIRALAVTKNKLSYAQPVSAQAEGKKISYVPAEWNRVFFDELEAFPEGNYDDQVDALSLAFRALVHCDFMFTKDWDDWKGIERAFVSGPGREDSWDDAS